MKIDRFLWFCLPEEDKRFLAAYHSPRGESSLFKRIPITDKARAKKICRRLGMKTRIVYRGPRRGQVDPSFTRARDATHFSVYSA
jgi:hypothetical protein